MRHIAVLFALAGCGSDPTGEIEVLPGPEMRIAEGTTLAHELRLGGERGAEFAIELEDQAMLRLAAGIVHEDGATFLSVTPSCAAIGAGETRELRENIVVTAVGADPVTVAVSITPNELGDCAVRITGWSGLCDEPPASLVEVIQLDPELGDQPICVEVRVPEPTPIDVRFDLGVLEPLTIQGDDLLDLTPSTTPYMRQLIAVGVADRFRGERELEARWADGSVRLPIAVGEPGSGVLRNRTTPVDAVEYRSSIVKFASSYYAKAGTVGCVRATPRAPTTMSLVVRSDLDEIISQGELACGVTINTIELVTAIDSTADERVDLSLERCTPSQICGLPTPSACCQQPDATVVVLDTAVLDVPSRSVVESVDLGAGVGGERACVDLDRDGVPELFVRDAAGTRLVVGGVVDDVRFTGTVSLPTPQSVLALSWFDGASAVPTLVGEFPTLRRATPTGWVDEAWAPRPPNTTTALRTWVAAAPSRGAGASYLAVAPSPTTILFACVSPACANTDGPTVDVGAIPNGNIAVPTHHVGYTIADHDGDQDLDLLVAVESIASTQARPIRLVAYDLGWNGHQLVSVAGPIELVTAATPGWDTLQFVSLADRTYILARGVATNAVLELCATCTPTSIPTVGRPLQIAEVADRLMVSTDLGVWELAGTSWIQRDPERVRTQQTSVPSPGPTYGQHLAACLTSTPSMLFDVEVGARWSLADVTVDTLPHP